MEQDRPSPMEVSGLVSPEQEFEQLRQGFHERLRKDLARLTSLTATVQSADIDLALVVGDIGMFAHRLRGAALVFGYPEIGDAAKAVEEASEAAAPDKGGTPDEQSIVCTMQALAMKLTEETGVSALPAPAATKGTGDE